MNLQQDKRMAFRNFFRNLWEYVTSTIFWKTVIKLFVFVVLVLLLTSAYLRLYTRHGREYLAPELRGYTLPQAYDLVKKRGFKLKVIDSIDNSLDNPLPPGTIVDQSPPANFNIKKGRTIFVTIIAYRVKMVSLPDLPGYVSITQAENELKPLGLRVGKISYIPSYKDDGLVYAMIYKGDTVQPGFKVPKGSRIDLIVLRVAGDSVAHSVDTLRSARGDNSSMWDEF